MAGRDRAAYHSGRAEYREDRRRDRELVRQGTGVSQGWRRSHERITGTPSGCQDRVGGDWENGRWGWRRGSAEGVTCAC